MSDDEDEVLMASVKTKQKVTTMMPNMEDSDSWEDVPNEDQNNEKVQMSEMGTQKEIEFNNFSEEVLIADSADSEEKKHKSNQDASC